mgnify:CR=1 FL=1|jgi:tetratricopeptide (TPR) repeat protein
MLKGLIFFFLLLSTVSNSVYGQQKTALKQFNRYVLLGESNIEFHQDKSFAYLDSATALLPKISNKTALAAYFSLDGFCNYAQKNFDASLVSLRKSEKLFSYASGKVQSMIYYRIARTFEKKSDLDSSWVYWNKSFVNSTLKKDSLMIAKNLLGMGDFAYYHFSLEKATPYYFDALRISEKCKSYSSQAEALSSIGFLYQLRDKYGTALNYYLKSLSILKKHEDVNLLTTVYAYISNLYIDKIRNERKGLYFLKKREELVWKYPTNQKLTNLYTDYASLYWMRADFGTALFYYKKGLDYAKKTNSSMEVGRLYFWVGSAYGKIDEYDKAISYIDSALVIGLKNKDQQRLWWCYWDLANVQYAKGDYKKAYENYQKYVEVNETILNEDYQNQLAEMSIKYGSEKKEAENNRLRKELHLKKQLSEKERNQRYLLGSVLLLVTITLFITIRFYRIKQRDNILLKQQKDEIEQKTEALNKQAAEISKYRTQMNPHFIFNALNSVQHFILKENKNSALDYLNDFSRLMRLTLYNSDKDFISLNDEKDFLSFYVNFEQQRFKDKFEFDFHFDPELDAENVLIAPMLIQPFVENAIKHAGLSSIKNPLIEVSILLENEVLHVSIDDNGKGRSFDKITVQHESKGIEITKRRIEALFKLENKEYPHQLLTITDKVNSDNQPCGVRIDFYIPLIENF